MRARNHTKQSNQQHETIPISNKQQYN